MNPTKPDEDKELSSLKYELSKHKSSHDINSDKKKKVDTTIAMLAVCLFILIGIGLYGVPYLIEQKNWWFIIFAAFIGFVSWRCFEALQEYEKHLNHEINASKSLMYKYESMLSSKTDK